MFHLTVASYILFSLQIVVTITAWVILMVGPFFKYLGKDFRKDGLESYSPYSSTHIGTWVDNKVPEMYAPVIFIPVAIIFPFLGMFLIRNCLKKNLSSVGKIVLLVITIALYVINGASMHFGIRNISLNKKDTIHIGWFIAVGLNWLGALFIFFNICSIWCCEIPNKKRQLDDLNPSGYSGSLSGTTSSKGSGMFSGTRSKTGSKSGSKSGSKMGSKMGSTSKPISFAGNVNITSPANNNNEQ
ncbi:Hypothetical protein SRAE_1000111800 [Strongyloides ratti]|uniref:Uncharacterized protein n=1 Tax=Strongyloides ratti TaxID=34506 RepID=A0A090KZJ9_STRRB|nr:Hypothetical protein SRAE_1000111800 [Strongyloides ratti]CEF62851.1 Hypothetical protein SRAE_1000111800 [Strongyloides ratti]